MAGKHYDYEASDCTGGINQNPTRILPNQCADALNVYAPDGVVIQRPGYVGSTALLVGNTTTQTVLAARKEDNAGAAPAYTSPNGAGVLDLSGLVAEQDRWYIGHTVSFGPFGVCIVGANSNATRFSAEYYDGANWRRLNVSEVDAASKGSMHLADAVLGTSIFLFARPEGHAAVTVDSLSRFWYRFRLLNADIDAACTVDVDNVLTVISTQNTGALRGLFVAAFPTTRRSIAVTRAGTTIHFDNMAAGWSYTDNGHWASPYLPGGGDLPASLAVVPQYEEAYIAYSNQVTVHKAHPVRNFTVADGWTGDDIIAQVDRRDSAIGPGADYDEGTIVMLPAFPKAKFITFWDGRLWVIDEHDNLRWTGKSPFHRVWPALAHTPVLEADDSPVTALKALYDQMMVYKNDSIWGAVFIGLREFETPMYAVRKMRGGVGCVAGGSLVEIPEGHVFLSEDGVQVFNGMSTRKASDMTIRRQTSDRLKSIWPRITKGKRAYSSAIHWRAKNLYILSVPVDGSAVNNLTLVWNYEDDTWWIWDNIEAQYWLVDEDQNDEETIYFGDSSGRIFQFGVSDEDNGAAITARVDSRRFSYRDLTTDTLREVEISSRNTTDALDLQVSRNGTPFQNSPTAATLDLSDHKETEYGDAMGSNMSWIMDRVRSLYYRVTAKHHQVRVSTARKGRPFYLSLLRVGYKRHSR